MAFLIYHERYDGRLAAVVSSTYAKRVKYVKQHPEVYKRLSLKRRLYIDNIKQVSLPQKHDHPDYLRILPAYTELYDSRYR